MKKKTSKEKTTNHKRCNGEGTITHRKDGRYEFRYRANGVKKSIYAKTKKELMEKRDKLLPSIKSSTKDEKKVTLLSDYIELYLNLYKRMQVKQSTYDLYKQSNRLYIKGRDIDRDISTISNDMLQTHFNELSDRMGYETVKRVFSMLKEVFFHAHKSILIDTNPMETVRKPKKSNCNQSNNRPAKFLDLGEILELTKIMQESKDKTGLATLVILLQYSGLRIGEALALTWNDINNFGDPENMSINVSKSVRRVSLYDSEKNPLGTKLTATEPKSQKSIRTVPIAIVACQSLIKYKKIQEEYIRTHSSIFKDNNLIFPTELGTYQDSQNVQKRFKKLLKKSAFRTDFSFHTLRHSYASLLIGKDVNIKVVSETLGHSDVGTTLKTYVHTSDELKKLTANKMNELTEGFLIQS